MKNEEEVQQDICSVMMDRLIKDGFDSNEPKKKQEIKFFIPIGIKGENGEVKKAPLPYFKKQN